MSTNRSRTPSLAGRADALQAIRDLVERAELGAGGGLTLVGEPGIGKTALIDRAVEVVAEHPHAQVVHLRGVEAELELPWSCLAALLDGMLGGLDQLAPARREALEGALAMVRTPAPVEPFAVALATRDLLIDAAEAGIVVVFVDDLPWVDLPTRRALAFVARRLQFERIAIVAARRVGTDDSTDTGPALLLDAVGDDVADEILLGLGVTGADVRRTLIDGSGGVPLVLVEAAHLLDADQRAGRADLPDPLPIGPSGQRVVDVLMARLDDRCRSALVVAAADPGGDLDRVVRALGSRSFGLGDLEVAEELGVVTLDRDRITFRHPLMRSAAYHDAPRADRRAAHRALADTLPDRSALRAWHLARAAVGPDEGVAAALDEAAEVTAQRGAPTTAARSWELASRLSPQSTDRVRRLRLAASALVDAGMTGAAGRLLDQSDAIVDADPAADSLVERTRRRQLRCRLPPSSGGIAEAAASLRKSADEVAGEVPNLAVDLLVEALASYIRSGALADMASAVEEAVLLRDRVDDDRARRVDVLLGALQLSLGQLDGVERLERYHDMIGPDRTSSDAMFLAELVAPTLGFLRRSEESDRLLAELETDLRARGAIRPLISVLGAESLARYGRSFPACVNAADEAIALAEANGTPELASLAACSLSLAAAVIGDEEMSRRAAALLEDVPEPERRAIGPIGEAYLAYNTGRYADADARYCQIVELSPIGVGLVRWETEWIEALLRSGRRQEAHAVLAELEAVVGSNTLVMHGINRTRAMLADDDDEAFARFAEAAADAKRFGNAFTRGRVDLVWGERLRRARHRSEARARLDRAVEQLRTCGATSYAERAIVELRAAGGVVDDDARTSELLTAHELQVARLVVGGLSNRDLAARLFISPRTVEAHLTAIFRKLGVANRRELSARALGDVSLQP